MHRGSRHQRARESDLIYEAYYAAFRTDLGHPAPDPPDPEPGIPARRLGT